VGGVSCSFRNDSAFREIKGEDAPQRCNPDNDECGFDRRFDEWILIFMSILYFLAFARWNC